MEKLPQSLLSLDSLKTLATRLTVQVGLFFNLTFKFLKKINDFQLCSSSIEEITHENDHTILIHDKKTIALKVSRWSINGIILTNNLFLYPIKTNIKGQELLLCISTCQYMTQNVFVSMQTKFASRCIFELLYFPLILTSNKSLSEHAYVWHANKHCI